MVWIMWCKNLFYVSVFDANALTLVYTTVRDIDITICQNICMFQTLDIGYNGKYGSNAHSSPNNQSFIKNKTITNIMKSTSPVLKTTGTLQLKLCVLQRNIPDSLLFLVPGTHFTNSFRACNPNLVQIDVTQTWKIDPLGQITILHMAWQLSHHAMVKIVNWLIYCTQNKRKKYFDKILILSSKSVCNMCAWLHCGGSKPWECLCVVNIGIQGTCELKPCHVCSWNMVFHWCRLCQHHRKYV